MKALDKLRLVSSRLARVDLPDPAKEAEILITETLGLDKVRLYSGSAELSPAESSRIDVLTDRRLRGEPLQYLLGRVSFCGLSIHVGPGVLIPRPETELLVDRALKELRLGSEPGSRKPVIERRGPTSGSGEKEGPSFTADYPSRLKILDLCTGSGCIALALAKHLPSAIVYGVDSSAAALGYALRNACEHRLRNALFIRGDLFNPIGRVRFGCIAANPPYVRRSDIAGLQREIRDYEPLEALDGGDDGLRFYREILTQAPRFLDEEGLILLEVGFSQAEAVEGLARAAGLDDVAFVDDLCGVPRVMVGSRQQR